MVGMGSPGFVTTCCFYSPCTATVKAWTCYNRVVRTSCWIANGGGDGEARGSAMGLGASLRCEECPVQLREVSWAQVFIFVILSTLEFLGLLPSYLVC